MRQKIYTINDFDFKPHGIIGGAVQGMLNLPNGITVSIVGGGEMGRLYGDGKDTFEIAAWLTDTGDWIDLGDDDDILRYVDKDKLQIILLDLSRK
ncbi:hypothetical protein UFOVP117_267 [uncultured Caudovirales phage]|uniref:Uncharacterized protein n=1 Tax=uncultured Caudovirales phage TaxID=2100421 RepID=A0A6J5L6V2_9CAUD|nr:hypothetical protein UFOVP117_267 [uncultured Caudovirales phage]